MNPGPDSRSLESGDDDELYVLDGVPISYALDDGNGNRRSRTVYQWRARKTATVVLHHDPQEETLVPIMPDCAAERLRDNLARHLSGEPDLETGPRIR
jgi:hypothetical protein